MRGNIRSFFCALFGALLLAYGIVGVTCDSVYAEAFEGELYARAAVLMDADSGRVLYGKNADTVLAMASTTKIMTCILVLEYGNPEDMAEVSAYAASMPKVKLYVKRGETYRVGDLLYSLMLESHNDSAVVLAEYVGSRYLEDLAKKPVAEYTAEESRRAVAAFAALMNEKARKLGCENTWFITPNGLDAEETVRIDTGEECQKEHGTTAAELARIMAYCIMESPEKDAFREITGTQSYQFAANGRSFSCNNHNAFLGMMDGAFSGKTGFTSKAGYCYVGALERDGRTFVVALLACGWPNNKNYKWSDTGKLMKYGLEQYAYRRFPEGEEVFDAGREASLPVQDGQTMRLGTPAYTALAVRSCTDEGPCNVEGLLMREDEEVTISCEIQEVLKAPVSAGTRVGTISYSVDDVVYRREEIVTVESIEKIDFAWCLEQIIKRFLF